MIFILTTVALPIQTIAQQGYSPKDVSVVVLRDGSVNIQYTVLTLQSPAIIQLIGFDGGSASTLKMENGHNTTVPYSLNGNAVTVTEPAGTNVTAYYNTFKLTSKNGAIWSLRIDSPVSWSVAFPLNTNITGWSVPPEYIYKGTPLYFVFPRGNASVSYELGYEALQPALVSIPPQFAIAVGLAVAAGGSSFVVYRRFQWRLRGRRLMAKHKSLNEEEKRILIFLSKSRGKALETELVGALALSRTSAWRHVRNLEDQGLVVTEKLGSQNLVKMKA